MARYEKLSEATWSNSYYPQLYYQLLHVARVDAWVSVKMVVFMHLLFNYNQSRILTNATLKRKELKNKGLYFTKSVSVFYLLLLVQAAFKINTFRVSWKEFVVWSILA